MARLERLTEAPEKNLSERSIQVSLLHIYPVTNLSVTEPIFLQNLKKEATMKATKLIAIAVIIGIAGLAMGQTEKTSVQPPDAQSIDLASNLIPLQKAMKTKGLVDAMRAQLTPKMLETDKPVYIAAVRYKHSIYYVYGTLKEWWKFFGHQPGSDILGVASNLIPLQKAMKSKGLVDAMRAQLKPEMLEVDRPIYIAAVRYKHSIHYVYGTLEDWKHFFLH